ncbi:unnamed protein product [Hermetia illucens]|uniref:Uncharacterized protein n=1 Tax=Hermetia illucens TaxID=343691 RepID=A0A7R8YXD0_HERIL|nr:unnamed protein product [Hermetia illucens]
MRPSHKRVNFSIRAERKLPKNSTPRELPRLTYYHIRSSNLAPCSLAYCVSFWQESCWSQNFQHYGGCCERG